MTEPTVRERCLAILEKYYEDEGPMLGKAAAGDVIFAPNGAVVRDVDKLDSLDRTEFVMAVEEAFDPLEIPDVIASGFRTLDDVVRYVEAMTAEAAHGAH
jgi:acyl carrier protein